MKMDWNLKIETQDATGKRVINWYIATGSCVVDAIEDAFNHYPWLRQTYCLLWESHPIFIYR